MATETARLLEQLLGETETPLAKAKRAQREAEEQVRKIEAERYGLQLALARHLGEPEPAAPAPPNDHEVEASPVLGEWAQLNRGAAAERALNELGRPADRKEIVRYLTSKGRTDTVDLISAALSYGQRNGRVKRLDDGSWTTPEVLNAEHANPVFADQEEMSTS